ncbi:DUF177 domain-containing protein [Lichenicola sp.]|uniref:DUF177 domain-containing protein n=1 Tax=Lichenicola sp. TaxID=2804529 RepID=UPI003B00C904
MTAKPELSRRIAVRSLGVKAPGAGRKQGSAAEDVALEVLVEADPAERLALAQRLHEPSVEAFSCRFRLSAADPAGVIEADGLLTAQLSRTCVVTLEDFPAVVAEQFRIRFVPAERSADEVDLDLDLEADDDVPYGGTGIDLGEAAVEQLALALDPYPRKPGAEPPPGVVRGDPPTGAAGLDLPPGERLEAVADLDGVASMDAPDPDRRPHPFAGLARLKRPPD